LTSSTAINYNSEASIPDDVNYPCIEPVFGCTVNSVSYYGVDDDTPGYKSGWTGDSWRAFGKTLESVYLGPAVVSYDSSATVNSGCVVAIEGCMDSTAANYDSKATINSNTWCVPTKIGCMMPILASVASTYNNPQEAKIAPGGVLAGGILPAATTLSTIPSGIKGATGLDVPQAHWDIATSVHDPDSCIVGRYGCTTESVLVTDGAFTYTKTAVNFDSEATIPAPCFYNLAGCLHPGALNFLCLEWSATPTTCSPSSIETTPTVHVKDICVFPGETVAVVEEVTSVKATLASYSVEMTVVMSGSVEDYDDTTKGTLIAAYKTTTGITGEVGLTVKPASVSLTFNSTTTDAEEANTLQTTVANTFTDVASVQSALGNTIGVQVLSPPAVSTTVTVLEEAADEGLGAGGVIGIIIAVLILIVGGVVLYKKKKQVAKKTVFPA